MSAKDNGQKTGIGKPSSPVDVDALLKDSEEALKRIEAIEQRNNAPWTVKIQRHVKRNSHRLVNLGLAAGLVGLSLVRYQEKYAQQDTVADLNGRIDDVEEKLSQANADARAGSELADAVEDALENTSAWHIKSALQQTIERYRDRNASSRAQEDDIPSTPDATRPFI